MLEPQWPTFEWHRCLVTVWLLSFTSPLRLRCLLVSHLNLPLSSPLFALSFSKSRLLFSVPFLSHSPSLFSIKPEFLASGLSAATSRVFKQLSSQSLSLSLPQIFHFLYFSSLLLKITVRRLCKRAVTTFILPYPSSLKSRGGWQRANFSHYYHTNLMPLICNKWNSLSWWRGLSEQQRKREMETRERGELINNSICCPAWGSISSVSDCQCLRRRGRSCSLILTACPAINGHNLISHYHHQWRLACRACYNSIRQTGVRGWGGLLKFKVMVEASESCGSWSKTQQNAEKEK